ncbi:TPA: peptidylprolyl isomerase [Candidatus Woesearchaeota archaeon]|nr:peptidylprolyl isomerase [Candidatus Woesearchaeota archaeon]HIH39290.1 peptidylprolyl isomerase [Candidatus Woesearchaeota archaeon]
MTVKKHDFIEVEYTGIVKEDGFVFDTTSEKTAKEKGIHNPYAQYGPTVVCVGEHQLLKGLDEGVIGKEVGKEYKIDLAPEQAFGRKSAQLLKLIPMSAFKKGNTRPEVGMQIDVDGNIGIVKTVTGGRIMVDFNHPLSSKELSYTIKINKIVTDDAEKIISMISLTLNLKKDKINVSVSNGKATVKTLKLPEVFQKEFEKKIKELVPTIKELVFIENKEEKQPTSEKQPLNTSKK